MSQNITPLVLAPATPPRDLTVAFNEVTSLLTKPRKTLSDALLALALGGGTEVLTQPVSGLPVFKSAAPCLAMSGYNYAFQNKMIAELRFGITESGYFVLQTTIFESVPILITHYYTAMGIFAFSEHAPAPALCDFSEMMMESECPILNHLYAFLSTEYALTHAGTANTKRIHTIENFLQRISKIRKNELSVSKGIRDQAVLSLTQKIMRTDLDPVLTWRERFEIFKGIKAERAKILDTKQRAHRKLFFTYQFPIHLNDFYLASVRFFKRPTGNLLGLLDRIFLDPIRWFFKVVRSNMHYSIALAIYSPFTYYFITQPMNPHAMWAVGKVRSAYIDSTDKVKSVMGSAAMIPAVQTTTQALTAPVQVQTSQPSNNTPAASQPTSPIKAFISFLGLGGGRDQLTLTTDKEDVNKQSWDERMSNFKAMQIAYEENMEIAPRLGRLEQMDTQLNWPIIVESAWMESERYLDQIKNIEAHSNDYASEFMTYIAAEKARTNQIELYLWDRNIRFILDHPFIMMDQGKEQTQFDYYSGRAFVVLREMTQSLMSKNSSLALPQGYDLIEKLASHFQADYKNGSTMFERLKNNSKVFTQNDSTDTKELRAYMKREWELLYLLQNKTQEASNFGLQMYSWSVRNAIGLTQVLYTSKRQELSLIEPLFKKPALNQAPLIASPSVLAELKRIDSQYEAVFHMMMLEYTSIRKEIGEHLRKDIEANQRRTIIGNVESFLKNRENLLKSAKLL